MVIRDFKHAVSLSPFEETRIRTRISSSLSRCLFVRLQRCRGIWTMCRIARAAPKVSRPLFRPPMFYRRMQGVRCCSSPMLGTANVDQVYDVYFLCDRSTRCNDSSVSGNHSVGAESLLGVFYCRLMRSISCCRGPGRQSPVEGVGICSRIIPMHLISYANAVIINLLST